MKLNTWESLQALKIGRGILDAFYDELKLKNPELYQELKEELKRENNDN